MKMKSRGGGGLFGFFRNAFGVKKSASESCSLDTVCQGGNASNVARFHDISTAILKIDVLDKRKRIQNLYS